MEVWKLAKTGIHRSLTLAVQDIYDALHHQMYFRPETIAIMDTPQVQRLRDVKQLSMASYIYPSANHRRQAHSSLQCQDQDP